MTDVVEQTENKVGDLKENLKKMPKSMRMFSLSMRSLYAEKAVGSSTSTSIKFRKLRDNTRQDAMVYLKGILPVSTKFVSSIKEYFEYFEALELEEWREMLPDILEETKTYKEIAQTVLVMHEEVLKDLKVREDEAKIIMTEFKDLQKEYEEQKKAFEATAKEKEGWAAALLFVPFVNLIATPLLAAAADEARVQAIARRAEAEVQGAAALVVAESLIPALSSFIDGLTHAAGFFSIMEHDLGEFESKAKRGLDAETETKSKLFYKTMKKQAKDIMSLCQAFYAVLPAIRTDFEAIPNEGTDQNYVDKWVEKKMAEIQKKRSSVYKFFSKIIKASGEDRQKAIAQE